VNVCVCVRTQFKSAYKSKKGCAAPKAEYRYSIHELEEDRESKETGEVEGEEDELFYTQVD